MHLSLLLRGFDITCRLNGATYFVLFIIVILTKIHFVGMCGGIVGALGSVLSLSITMKTGLQIFAGIFMVIMGLNMSGFGLFRKINIRLPWSAYNVKKKNKTPFLVGFLTGRMPCGPLQIMQLYALGTGNAFQGTFIYATIFPWHSTFNVDFWSVIRSH